MAWKSKEAITNRIQAQQKRIDAIDARIGALMTIRADFEDRMAELYEELRALEATQPSA